MNIKTKLAKTFLALLAVNQLACQDDKNIKDYWKLEEPTVNIWEEGQTDESKTIKEKISSFNKNKFININQVAYGSNIRFDNINSGVTFDIESICRKGEFEFKGSYFNQKIGNTIYLYNFLPIEAIINRTGMDNNTLRCKFNFVGKNKIGSKHTFKLNELYYQTQNSNGLVIFSNDLNEERINFLNENNLNGFVDTKYLDFTMDSNLIYFSRVSNKTSHALKDSKIYCDVSNAELRVSEMKTVGTDLNINEYILSLLPNYTGAILRGCRIVSYAVPNNEDMKTVKDYQLVWSPYFDILFKKPTLKIDVEMEYNPASYPKFNTEALEYKIASFKITNTGALPISVALPQTESPTNVLEAMVYAASSRFLNPFMNGFQRAGEIGKNLNHIFSPERVPDMALNYNVNSFLNLKYRHNLSKQAHFSVGETKIVDIVLSKNFSCTFNKKFPESGFYIQAILSKSEEDKLKILVQDHNQEFVIPIDYYMTDLVSKSGINPLSNKDYLIDTVIIPYFANLKVQDTFEYEQNYIKLLNSRVPQKASNPGYINFYKELKRRKMKGFEKYCSVFE